MQTRDKGIRSILAPPLSPAEIKEDQDAMRAVINKVGRSNTYQPMDRSLYNINESLDTLQAASTKPIKEVKDKDGFTPKENAQILKHLTRPPSPYSKDQKKQIVSDFKKSAEKFNNETAANKVKPMPIVKYIDRINHLYGNNHSEDAGPTKQGMKDLQRVTDAVHKQDGAPTHQPEWRWSINRKELVDIKDPNFKGF